MIINIPLSKAYELLDKAGAIIVSSQSGNPLVYPSLSELTGELDNEFLFISWTDDRGHEFNMRFIEENNQNPGIDTMTNELILEDDEAENRLLLLTTMKL